MVSSKSPKINTMSTLSTPALRIFQSFASEKRAKFQTKVVNRITLLMSAGALIWAIGMFSIGAYNLLVLPVGYLFISALTAFLCKRTRFGMLACDIQMSISILFPCLFQLVAGGVMASGAVMLWSIVGLFGLSTYTQPKTVAKWAAYTVIVIAGCILFENTGMYTQRDIIGI